MAIKINNPKDNFNKIQVIEFRYLKSLKQNPKSTLFYRWQKIHIDENGNKSWSDEPIQEDFINDVDSMISQYAVSGDINPFEAFVSLQKTISAFINNKTDLSTEYEAD